MRVLAACEYSGRVREAFRSLGHEAWSCDLDPAEDSSPYHIRGDALEAICQGWDIVIAFPPCTHLCNSGARHFAAKRADGRQQRGIDFFMAVINQSIIYSRYWAVENPVGVMNRVYRKPDQIIQPWQYGHGETKTTCLWLGNLPKLTPTDIVDGRAANVVQMASGPILLKERSKDRSRTYIGVANAMATQWGVV